MYKFSNAEHTAVTNLETGAAGIHPGVWLWEYYQKWVDDGGITEAFDTSTAEERVRKEIKGKLAEIDSQVKDLSADGNTFEFNGNNYYADFESIVGYLVSLPFLPENFTIVWKTADKEADGVTNVEKVLDKAGVAGLAMAYMQHRGTTWNAGETRKKALKQLVVSGKTVDEIKSVDVRIPKGNKVKPVIE